MGLQRLIGLSNVLFNDGLIAMGKQPGLLQNNFDVVATVVLQVAFNIAFVAY